MPFDLLISACVVPEAEKDVSRVVRAFMGEYIWNKAGWTLCSKAGICGSAAALGIKSMNFKSSLAIEVKDLCVCVCVWVEEGNRRREWEHPRTRKSSQDSFEKEQQTGTHAEGLLTKNAFLPAGRFLSMSRMIFYQSGLWHGIKCVTQVSEQVGAKKNLKAQTDVKRRFQLCLCLYQYYCPITNELCRSGFNVRRALKRKHAPL